jgi:hypothetical protein
MIYVCMYDTTFSCNQVIEEMKTRILLLCTVMVIIVSPTTASASSGFITNPTSNNSTGTGTTDPNYNTYQNLALGFNIKYLKNMTVSERLNNTQNIVIFKTPNGKPIREGITMFITVIPETNFLGQQYSLDQTVSNALATCCVGDNVTVTNKVKGMLNGIPAYKIENTVLVPKVFKNITSSLRYDGKPITQLYRTGYVTFRDGIGYWISFLSFSQNRYNAIEKTMIDSFRFN